jgi:hypothetical protein
MVNMLTKVIANVSDGLPDLYFKVGSAINAGRCLPGGAPRPTDTRWARYLSTSSATRASSAVCDLCTSAVRFAGCATHITRSCVVCHPRNLDLLLSTFKVACPVVYHLLLGSCITFCPRNKVDEGLFRYSAKEGRSVTSLPQYMTQFISQ